MNRYQKWIVWAALAAGVAVVTLFAIPSYRQGEASIAGKKAENFSLEPSISPDATDKPGHLSDLRGRVVVLNFWASWCPPCVDETPSLNHLEEYLKPRGGKIVGVSVDDDPAAYFKFLKDQNVDFLVHRDASRKIATDYGTTMFPETYVIDRSGHIARKIIGPQQWDSPEMLAYFKALLGES